MCHPLCSLLGVLSLLISEAHRPRGNRVDTAADIDESVATRLP